MPEEKKKKQQGGIAAELFLWAQALVLSLVVLVVINIFFFRISGVVGGSMNPTLYEGDRVLLRVCGYKEPQRGDIIVVSAPNYDDDPLVKRVIAVGNDVIRIDYGSGAVFVNDEKLDEPYIAETIRTFGDTEYPYTVPEGYIFFMGDNRNRSTDSRFSVVGVQPKENVIGKVVCRIWPINKIGGVK